MSSAFRVSALFAGLVAIALATGTRMAAAQEPDPPQERISTADGVYTVEQARRGEKLLRDECSACHMQDRFTGRFLQAWNGATVGLLYDRIRTTMPEDRPSGLKTREYADILAYIFELNGIPPGEEELASRKSELDRILIQWRR
jgi:mono/diheme cytochrome c family protein